MTAGFVKPEAVVMEAVQQVGVVQLEMETLVQGVVEQPETVVKHVQGDEVPAERQDEQQWMAYKGFSNIVLCLCINYFFLNLANV